MEGIDFSEIVPPPLPAEVVAGVLRLPVQDIALIDGEDKHVATFPASNRDAWVLASADKRTVMLFAENGQGIVGAIMLEAGAKLGWSLYAFERQQEGAFYDAALALGWRWTRLGEYLDQHAVDMAQVRLVTHALPVPADHLFAHYEEGTLH